MKKFFHILFLLSIYACQSNDESKLIIDTIESQIIECDAEEVVSIDGEKRFESINNNFFIEGANLQSDEVSKSGKFSVKLDTSSESSLILKLKNLKAGSYIRASVWQLKGNVNAFLLATARFKDASQTFQSNYYECNIKEGDWIQHNIALIASPNLEELKFEVKCKKGFTYFDDLKVEVLPKCPPNNIDEELTVFLPEKEKTEFFDYISKARHGSIIKGKYKEYVKGRLWDGKVYSRIKMKLKGDWNDHLGSAKISARIKVRGDSAYNGLKSFSLQHPKTRNYLDEWVVHKIADQEDVLSTTYDFVNVKFYNTYLGLYAVEEHFDKQLLESRNRREGPILKMDEDGVWDMGALKNEIGDFGQLPYFNASMIDVFKDNRTMREMNLRLNFIEGSKLLQQFKNGSSDLSSIFDINQLAKYYAIMDISAGIHGLAWHNRRYYFNPVTQKLEMVIYDVMPFDMELPNYSIIEHLLKDEKRYLAESLDNQLLTNPEFKRLYLSHIRRMSSKVYLDSFFMDHNKELEKFETAIQAEEPYYQFNKDKFYQNAAFFRENINRIDEFWRTQLNKIESFKYWEKSRTYKPRNDTVFVEKISLNAYLQDSSNGKYKVLIENYHPNAIDICGYELENWKNHAFPLEPNITLKPYSVKEDTTIIVFDQRPDKLFFKVSNYLRRYFDVKVKPWPKPIGLTDRQKLQKSDNWKDYVKISGEKAVLNGKVVIDQLISIPEKYELQINAGTSIEFKSGGGVIAQNNVYAVGTSTKPIKIFALDSNSNGFTILKAEQTKFHHVNIDNLSNLSYGNWMLTGALTVYESNVEIKNCSIQNISSEDALNLIRCEFEIDNLLIENSASDGFDADFCSGNLSNSVFNKTLNDAIDFSGSNIEISDVVINEVGDKAISAGERSNVALDNVEINSSVSGVVAKDDSNVNGSIASISRTQFHFTAFQKKEEYGPAYIHLKGNDLQLNESNTIVGKGSQIKINDKEIQGDKRVNVDSLYMTIMK